MGKVVEIPLNDPLVCLSDEVFQVQREVDMSYAVVHMARCLACGPGGDSPEPDILKGFLELMAEHLETVKDGLADIQKRINSDEMKPTRKRAR